MARAFTIVMAGGSGTRFWPLSRADRPKQLLNLAGGEQSLLAATIQRALAIGAADDVLVVTSERLRDATAADVPQLPARNILAEPTGRNTAPCIGWAVSRVARIDPNAVCAVVPADHHIADTDAYLAVVRRALAAAEAGEIVTVGIRPRRPETGFGYIEMGEELEDGVHRARRFVEKPNRQRAEQFLASGNFLWNSGMFFFRAQAMLDAIRAHLPGLGRAVDRFLAARDDAEERRAVDELYPTLPDVSIDHGVMEKLSEVAVVPAADLGWSDLGGFASAWELATRDADGNAATVNTLSIDSRRCYVRAPEEKVVALIGVDDLVVIDTPDALLVVPRERAQDVKKVVEALKKRGDTERL